MYICSFLAGLQSIHVPCPRTVMMTRFPARKPNDGDQRKLSTVPPFYLSRSNVNWYLLLLYKPQGHAMGDDRSLKKQWWRSVFYETATAVEVSRAKDLVSSCAWPHRYHVDSNTDFHMLQGAIGSFRRVVVAEIVSTVYQKDPDLGHRRLSPGISVSDSTNMDRLEA
jgi:hypothetical protein